MTLRYASIILLFSMGLSLSAAADKAPPKEPPQEPAVSGKVEISELGFDKAKGVWRYSVKSPYMKAANAVEVLLPVKFDGKKSYRVLYVLPVEKGIGGRYGDGLKIIRKLDAHNRHQLICVAMAFDNIPWFMDHATDKHMRHETYLTKVIVPMIDRRYPTLKTKDSRLLLGFSKSGWGAFTLLLRNSDIFGYAAAWDSPLMCHQDDWKNWGISRAAGTIQRFKEYQPRRLFATHGKHFQDRARFALLGHKGFGGGGGKKYQGEHTHTRWAHQVMTESGIKHFYNNRIIVPHTWNKDWVGPAIESLITLADKPKTKNGAAKR